MWDFVVAHLLQPGLGNLFAYLAAHVLLCLLPAFFIAGAMTALIPKPTITRFLGRTTPALVAYPAAAGAGSVLAVCSCTIVPIFAGIYRKGAGLGPAITFLFFAPAANILALVYTGSLIGPDLALARFALALAFGIGIGVLMAAIFRADDAERDRATDAMFQAQSTERPRRGVLAFLALWIALLLAGTLKIDLLGATIVEFGTDAGWAPALQSALHRLVPFDAARGEEGVSVHGAALVVLLAGVGVLAWRGIERIHDEERIGGWVRATLWLIAGTLVFAALAVRATPGGLSVGITGRAVAVLVLAVALARQGRATLDVEALRDWLWESWRFVKQIFPLLALGVFLVGIARGVIRPEWIQAVAGHNTLLGNLAGVAFGVFMYFPTLVEVPIARLFLDLGMHRGPLLAYLMADPELSLQSILIVSAVIGRAKTWTYVAWVAVFSVAAGLAYGAWVDGASLSRVALAALAFVACLVAVVRTAGRFAGRAAAGPVDSHLEKELPR